MYKLHDDSNGFASDAWGTSELKGGVRHACPGLVHACQDRQSMDHMVDQLTLSLLGCA